MSSRIIHVNCGSESFIFDKLISISDYETMITGVEIAEADKQKIDADKESAGLSLYVKTTLQNLNFICVANNKETNNPFINIEITKVTNIEDEIVIIEKCQFENFGLISHNILFLRYGSLELKNCNFRNIEYNNKNGVDVAGGGCLCGTINDGYKVIIEGSEFKNISTSFEGGKGGAIYLNIKKGGILRIGESQGRYTKKNNNEISSTKFMNCRAGKQEENKYDGYGGGIFINFEDNIPPSSSEISVNDVTFDDDCDGLYGKHIFIHSAVNFSKLQLTSILSYVNVDDIDGIDDEDISGDVGENDDIIPLKYYWIPLTNGIVIVSSDGDRKDFEFCGITQYPCVTLNYGMERLHSDTNNNKRLEIKSSSLDFSNQISLSENVPLMICKSSGISESKIKCLGSEVRFVISSEVTIENLLFIFPNSLSSSFFLLTNSLILVNCSFSYEYSYNNDKCMLHSSFISLTSDNNGGDINVTNSSFCSFSLNTGSGCIINAVINSGHKMIITNSTFINCSVSESKSQGGAIYGDIRTGGRVVIGNDDDDNDSANKKKNELIIENVFENCLTRTDEDGDGRGGAISLHVENDENEITSNPMNPIRFVGIEIKLFYFFFFVYYYLKCVR
jgi:hypothetical protein